MPAYTVTELQSIARWLKDGLSAARIADRLSALRGGPASRNAVIGVVHRNADLRAIGFANPQGRSGGRPRKNPAKLVRSARPAEPPEQAKLPRQAKLPGQAKLPVQAKPVKQSGPARHVTPARLAPPVWLPQRQFVHEIHGPDSEALKVPVPRPVAAVGPQPHVAAMRFIDCLFNRCRAPLDLTLEEDPENDAPGSRPGLDMLCCGLRTRPLKSYCAYHAASLCDHRRAALADAG
ncbi:GcrA cell cycle regulator [Mesorhizobium robiniae]|uniref:GcrA cell cycle regulator n=1 Tax=Mesorhizobium robiniae TaxID=559315 RepID=A0ABV2GH36_9HYPH